MALVDTVEDWTTLVAENIVLVKHGSKRSLAEPVSLSYLERAVQLLLFSHSVSYLGLICALSLIHPA